MDALGVHMTTRPSVYPAAPLYFNPDVHKGDRINRGNILSWAPRGRQGMFMHVIIQRIKHG